MFRFSERLRTLRDECLRAPKAGEAALVSVAAPPAEGRSKEDTSSGSTTAGLSTTDDSSFTTAPTTPAQTVVPTAVAFDAERICEALRDITLADFDIMPSQVSAAQGISCVAVEEGPLASAILFVIPKGAHIELHDHPTMTVVCKVLQGKIRVRAFDWVTPLDDPLTPVTSPRLARKVTDEVRPTGHTCVVGPKCGGVVHELHAIDGPAAFFDVISPPYDAPPHHIAITYFRAEEVTTDEAVGEDVFHLIPLPQAET